MRQKVSIRTESRRPAIAPEYNTGSHRLFSPATRPSFALISFKQTFEANEPALASAFAQIEKDYQSGVVAQRASDEQMSRVRARPDLSWEPGEIESVAPYEDEKLRVAQAMEANAELILRTVDDLLSAVVVAFNGKDVPLNVGPAIGPGVPTYEVLRAIGNYVRHRSECRITYGDKKRLKDVQLEFVRPLARVISGRAGADGSAAYEIVIKEPSPMLRILDALSGYSAETGTGSFEVLKANVCATADAIIEDQWPAWWEKRH
jgi:hypothetical protein